MDKSRVGIPHTGGYISNKMEQGHKQRNSLGRQNLRNLHGGCRGGSILEEEA
jgi:hypothetical protein